MQNAFTRRQTARRIREEAAELAFLRPHPEQLNNGEENSIPNYIANFHKGLPQNDLGEVDPQAYKYLLKAVSSGKPEAFEKIPLALATDFRKLANPQAGLAFDLEGSDAQSLTIPPAPRIDSPENSAEMGELYWMALLRDVNFTDFDTDPGIAEAAHSLSTEFSDFRGPKVKGQVTPATIFRGITPGDLTEPFLSQFLLRPIAYGALKIYQRQQTVMPGSDFMTDYDCWLQIQRGFNPGGINQLDATRRYIRNMRDLANYVHFDRLYQAYLNACLILLDMRLDLNAVVAAPFDIGNPYLDSFNQQGLGTFGGAHILSLVTEVATRALKAVWYQKWYVHRRLRPETFGGRIHNHINGKAVYPINSEILNSSVLDKIRLFNDRKGSTNTYLLPQVFPEGSPMHPAYGAGHATVAGACVTILKAFFDESDVIPDPVAPNADGTDLIPYTGPDKDKLTVGGELNKLAANIAIGRNMAGVHWRTDYAESIKLGEAIAIGILQEQKPTYNEEHFFTLTKFDGTTIFI